MPAKASVGETATANAFYCPGLVLAAVALLPSVGLGAYAATQLPIPDRTKHMLLFSIVLSVAGYFATVTALPGVSEKLKNKLSGVDLGKKFFGGPNAGETDHSRPSLLAPLRVAKRRSARPQQLPSAADRRHPNHLAVRT